MRSGSRSLAALISCAADPGAAIIRPVPASVAARRCRCTATINASTPPAMAVKTNADMHQCGADEGADGGHQLHVPGSRGAERVAWHHQQEPDKKSGDRFAC